MDSCILHVDMNAFYASVEEVYRPELRQFPMAVAGDPKKRHGIILAKNQLASAFKIQTGETIHSALTKCPSLRLVPPHHDRYDYFSERALSIYLDYSPRVEPFGLDEAWIDLGPIDGLETAQLIQQRVKRELGLQVSIGLSWCKTFAKLGSDLQKPMGLTQITRENYRTILFPRSVNTLLFVGRKTTQKLHRYGIFCIGDLARLSLEFLETRFGSQGRDLYQVVQGLEDKPVQDFCRRKEQKSIGNSFTYPCDLVSEGEKRQALVELCETVSKRLREKKLFARGIELSYRKPDLSWHHKQQRRPAFQLPAELYQATKQLYSTLQMDKTPIRSLGLRVYDLERLDFQQVSFFDSPISERQNQLLTTIDELQQKYGKTSIRTPLLT